MLNAEHPEPSNACNGAAVANLTNQHGHHETTACATCSNFGMKGKP